jgi:C-terminal processing protease CtpA/Prc
MFLNSYRRRLRAEALMRGIFSRLPAAGRYIRRGSIVEGRGVSPDVDVPLSFAELRQGKDNQLAAAVATVNMM